MSINKLQLFIHKIYITAMLPISSNKNREKLVYPALDMHGSSRFSNQRVNNAKIALMKHKKKIRIENINNNFQYHPISSDNLEKFTEKDGLIHTYRAINSLPINYPNQKKNRGVKILICVCMYNQSANAVYLTLKGIYSNLKQLSKNGISPGDVAVVIVQDGILKLLSGGKNKRYSYAKGQKSVMEFYRQLDKVQKKKKCYLQERLNVILDQIQNYKRQKYGQNVNKNDDIPPSIQKNISLVYQNLWWPSKTHGLFDRITKNKTDNDQWKIHQNDMAPQNNQQQLRVFTCFKHTNGKKLSSHLLFFQGFCRYLNPQFCVLLDVGTTPHPTGLLNLIRGFQQGQDVGGVSGFMSVDSNFPSQQGGDEGDDDCIKNGCLMKHILSIEKAQQYEYIMSHFLDKNQQSALGFLHVLPGAWSAYRYDALVKSDKYQPNLLERNYFKMLLTPNFQSDDYAEANMYLAQDRILSLGIYCQMDRRYILRYVPDARADTDPMKDHQNLMKQRRRWINSSLFAFMYVYRNFAFNIMQSRHNFLRRYITINLSMIIALLSSINTYITPSVYFFTLYVTIYQLRFPGSEWVAKAVCFIYLMTLFIAIMGGLAGNSWLPKAHIISIIFGFFTVGLTFLVIWNILLIYLQVIYNPITGKAGNFDPNNAVLMQVLILVGLNLFCFFFLLIIHIPTHLKYVWKIILDTPSYIAYNAAYSHTMVVHSFCNVDDVSWGTKGSSDSHSAISFVSDKVLFVGTWGLVNGVLAWIFLYVDIISRENGAHKRGDVVLVALAYYGTGYLVLKTILAIYHHFKWIIVMLCRKEFNVQSKQKVDSHWELSNNKWIKIQQQLRAKK